MKEKERRIQKALGTFPNGFRLTNTGRDELRKLDNKQYPDPFDDPEAAMHSVLMMIQEDPTHKTRESLLDDVDDFSGDPDKEIPAIKKAWGKALNEKLIEEY